MLAGDKERKAITDDNDFLGFRLRTEVRSRLILSAAFFLHPYCNIVITNITMQFFPLTLLYIIKYPI